MASEALDVRHVSMMLYGVTWETCVHIIVAYFFVCAAETAGTSLESLIEKKGLQAIPKSNPV